MKGPDFPTGGHILNSPDELKEIYRTGSGSDPPALQPGKPVRRRAPSKKLYITSIPYAVNKAQLVEQIGDVVLSRKMPYLVDVRDVSTDDVRIELDLKAGADDNLVMAYLFKNTSLQTTFAVNMTCLVPTENAEVGRPERLDLKQMLWHFLHFRLEVVTSRLEHELEQLQQAHPHPRGLREGLRRARRDHQDHPQVGRQGRLGGEDHGAVLARRRADRRDPRTEAVSAGPARDPRHPERAGREAEARRGRSRRCSRTKKAAGSWCATELEEIQAKYGNPKIDPRRSRIEEAEEVEYSAESFIVEEDNVVIVSRDGWVKRQKEVKDLSTTRLREGDSVLAAVAGSTRATWCSSATSAWPTPAASSTCRHRPATAIRCRSCSSSRTARRSSRPSASIRASRRRSRRRRKATSRRCMPSAVTSDGYAMRFSLQAFVEASTRSGRRYARTADGAEVVQRRLTTGEETVIAATSARPRDAVARPRRVNFLSGPGRGVILIKIDFPEDKVIGAMVSTGDRDLLTVETTRGSEQTISTTKYEVTGRGGKGRELMQRGGFTRVVPGDVPLPVIEGAA